MNGGGWGMVLESDAPWRVVSPDVTAAQTSQASLGAIIEERREQLGLTKSEAARLAGVSRGTWHAVETGQRTNMLADTLNLFDKALKLERGTLRRASRGTERIATPQTLVPTVGY